MRLLILNSRRHNHFSSYFNGLILDFLKEKNYFTNTKVGVQPAGLEDVSEENKIYHQAFPTGFFPLFKRFQIHRFIQKQNIQWLTLYTDKALFSSNLPQMIVPVGVENLVIKKPLPESATLIAGSRLEQEKLINLYPSIERNIRLVPFSPNKSFQPLSWSEKQAIKVEHTQGREYFLINPGGISSETFTSLLKAFSAFKKWQNSNMKLVIYSVLLSHQKKELKEKLDTYRYRDDVIFSFDFTSGKEYIPLLSSAYALVHLPSADNDVIPLLQAMQCETPCLSFATDIIEEYSEEAAVLIEPDNYELLSEKMILIYKDEDLRNRLIAKGRERAVSYSKENAMAALEDALPLLLH